MIGAFYIVALLVIGVGGDFPLNDDWAYGEGVRHLLLGDGLIMPAVCAAGIAHVALGFIAAKLLGYSYVSLRICSFLVTAVGVIALYVAAAALRIPRTQATFLALLYAANPILLNVTFSFMSDSTGLALNMVFLACLLRGLEKKSLATLMLAFFVLALAVTVRQSALVFLVLVPFCLAARFGAGRKKIFVFALALILPLVTAWACDHWLLTRHLANGFSNKVYDLVRQAHSETVSRLLFSAPDMVLPIVSAIGHVLCYLALFCLPALPALALVMVSRGRKLSSTVKFAIWSLLLVLASAMLVICFNHETMPFSENIWRVTTVGAQGILGIIRQPLQHKARLILTIISFVLAVPLTLSFALLGRKLLIKPLEWRAVILGASVSACLAFLTLETIVRCTDRYYLIALAPVLLTIGYIVQQTRTSLVSPISLLLLIVFASYSISANQEYLSSNRARWKAIDWLEASGVRAPSVDGGVEYNTLRDITVCNSKYRGDAPRDSWRWWPIKGETYIISLSPVPGYKTIHLEPYFSLVDRKTRNVEVLEQIRGAH